MEKQRTVTLYRGYKLVYNDTRGYLIYTNDDKLVLGSSDNPASETIAEAKARVNEYITMQKFVLKQLVDILEIERDRRGKLQRDG